MIGSFLAVLLLQSVAADVPIRRPNDPCIELDRRNAAVVDGERRQGRRLVELLLQKLPPQRPLFLVKRRDARASDTETLTTVLSVAQVKGYTSVVMLESCPAADVAGEQRGAE